MSAYFSIIRPLICIMASIAVYIGTVIAGADIIPASLFSPVLFGMFVVFLISGGGMIVNDVTDVFADVINKPKSPIPSGRMGRKFAVYYASVLFIIANVLAYRFLTEQVFYLSLLATILLIAYSAKLKNIIIAGHIIISFLIALTFVYGGMIAGNYLILILIASLAFFSNMGREVYKTIDEALGDKTHSNRTVALRFGVHRARIIGNAFLYIAVILSFAPYFLNMFDEIYLSFIAVADIFFVTASISPTKYSSILIKIGMLLVVIAFLFSAYIMRYGFGWFL